MAYRRKNGNPRYHATGEETPAVPLRCLDEVEQLGPRSALAAQAIRESSAYRDSSLSSAYADPVFSASRRESDASRRCVPMPQDSDECRNSSINKLNESKYGFWGTLANKAKSVLEDDNLGQHKDSRRNLSHHENSNDSQIHENSPKGHEKSDNTKLQKGLNAIASSFNYIGGRVGNALEGGLSIVENQTSSVIQETRKLNERRKANNSNMQGQATYPYTQQYNASHAQANQEIQLKAARDVANAMAAKAKLLMREMKTVKADLAFVKDRCAQLEEENRILRESSEKGSHPEDDDLIRLQLETLLTEKARLAHENSTYARENRFLREIVEYHQLTMQDVVYLDERMEEVTEVSPIGSSYSGSPNTWISSSGTSAISLPVPVSPASATKC